MSHVPLGRVRCGRVTSGRCDLRSPPRDKCPPPPQHLSRRALPPGAANTPPAPTRTWNKTALCVEGRRRAHSRSLMPIIPTNSANGVLRRRRRPDATVCSLKNLGERVSVDWTWGKGYIINEYRKAKMKVYHHEGRGKKPWSLTTAPRAHTALRGTAEWWRRSVSHNGTVKEVLKSWDN